MVETPAAALAKLPALGFHIGGELSRVTNAATVDHVYPASGEVTGSVPIAAANTVDEAVRAAREALPAWKALSAADRRGMLLRIAALLRDNAEELGEIAVLDNGAPHFGALAGVSTAADHFEYFAGWADKLEGAVIPVWPGSALDYTRREPYGVVGLIIPFNGPLVSMGLRVAPALATGNTIVLKPSELAPYGPLRFAQLCAEAGVPPGVFNVVSGDRTTGQALVEHPGVDKIHFTGSVPTARDVLTRAAQTIKPVALELGGKSANIVFADADLDQAAGMAVIASVVAMSGQTCICPSRLLVEASIYDDFMGRVVSQAEAVAIGDPFAPGTLMGPVISEAACERILGVVEQGREQQAGKLLTGGARSGGDLANGYFIQPTIFGEVDNNSSLARHEIFGPVLAAMRFDDEAHAVALANDTEYGLAGYVHTADMTRGHRMAASLDAGYLSINGWAMMPPGAPFGGNRRSGIGRLGGRAALDEFLRDKNVYVGL